MKISHAKKHQWFYVTLLMCALHICLNIFWILRNEDFMGFDVFEHLLRQELLYGKSLSIINASASFLSKAKDLLGLFFYSDYSDIQFPGFVYLVTVIQKIIFGDHHVLPFIANSFYLMVLLLSTYAIGALCVNGFAGFIAAFVLSTSPQIASIARYYGLDYPLMALVACSMLVLLKTNYCQNMMYLICFAILCAIGTLIKAQFLLFMAPAMAIVLMYGSKHKKVALKKTLVLCIVPALLFLIATQIWWKGNEYDLFNILWHHVFVDYNVTSLSFLYFIKQILYYVRTISYSMFPFYSLMLLGSLYPMFKNRLRLPSALKIVAWFSFSSYIVFTIISAKNTRYLFPAYFGYAVMISYFVCQVLPLKVRKIAIVCIFVLGSMQIIVMSFGPKYVYNWVRTGFIEKMRMGDASGKWFELPHESNIREHVSVLSNVIDETDRTILLLPQGDVAFSRLREYQYYLIRNRSDLHVALASWEDFDEKILTADYIIVRQGSAFERVLMGEATEDDLLAYPQYRVLHDNRHNYHVLWMGELCSLYGETVRNIILLKKIA